MNYTKTKLKLSGKNLTEFPEQVFKVKNLCKLDLSDNNIKSIPKEIVQLRHLETLNLRNNQIRNLFAKLFELPNLKILILSNNKIIDLPKQIENLKKLKILHLAYNNLTSLPEQISTLENLEEINLTGNSLDEVPPSFHRLTKLKTLWLAQNPLKKLRSNDFIATFPQLKSLYLYSSTVENKIATTDEAFVKASAYKGNCLPFLQEMVLQAESSNQSENQPKPQKDKMDDVKIKLPEKIFISYSHSDEEFLELLQVHLKVLSQGINIEFWDDTRIKSSDIWKEDIEKALKEATSAILLVSTRFLASDFIQNNELPTLLKAAKDNGTRIFSVIVRPCRFLETPSLVQFQSVNKPSKSLIECDEAEKDKIMMKLCADIQYHLNH